MVKRENPHLNRKVRVTWDGGNQANNGRTGVVVDGAYSSIVGWALTIQFDDDGSRGGLGATGLEFLDD